MYPVNFTTKIDPTAYSKYEYLWFEKIFVPRREVFVMLYLQHCIEKNRRKYYMKEKKKF